jgi:RES domain-containing protein
MAGAGLRHDRALLDALEAQPPEAFAGPVWRVTSQGRDPLRGSTAGGRWAATGTIEVLYTSLAAQGALAEIGYRLSLEPVWPSRVRHELHHIAALTETTLRLADLGALQLYGVDVQRYASFDYTATQAIGAAAYFLEFDGLIVPSARAEKLNLVLFMDRLDLPAALRVVETQPVDWPAWRAEKPRTR